DHGVEASLLVFRERFEGHGDGSVGEGVVVERRITVEIVGGSAFAIDTIRPFLLKWDSKESDTTGVSAHHVQEIANAGTFLNVVGEMTVRVVEFIYWSLCMERRRASSNAKTGKGSETKKRA